MHIPVELCILTWYNSFCVRNIVAQLRFFSGWNARHFEALTYFYALVYYLDYAIGGENMKKVFALILVLVLALGMCSAFAEADGYNYSSFFNGNYTYRGMVICTRLTVRETPSRNARSLGQLRNGDVVHILAEQGEFYQIDLSGTRLNRTGVGYILKDLVQNNPRWIVLTKYTEVCSDPWYSSLTLEPAHLSSGTPVLVINENYEFYCVQLHSGTAGVGFIRKSDVGQYTDWGSASYGVVIAETTEVWDYGQIGIRSLGKLNRDTVVQVLAWGDPYSNILYSASDGSLYSAWISTDLIQPVVN